MKTLLVPVDFSEASDNATRYAVQLSKFMRARIVLFHVFYIPVVAADAAMVVPDVGEMREYTMQRLQKLRETILSDEKNYLSDIECVCVPGLVAEEIEHFTEKHKVDLVVMGMQGVGFLTEKLIGSVTTAVLRTCSCPVMVIDREVIFSPPEKIVLACDSGHVPKSLLWPLKDIIRAFDAHLNILHVIDESLDKEEAEADRDAAVQGLDPECSLRQIDHSWHFVRGEDVVDSINDYVSEMGMDMIVMIPRKRPFFSALFTEPDTKRMAFHTNVPLLAIPE